MDTLPSETKEVMKTKERNSTALPSQLKQITLSLDKKNSYLNRKMLSNFQWVLYIPTNRIQHKNQYVPVDNTDDNHSNTPRPTEYVLPIRLLIIGFTPCPPHIGTHQTLPPVHCPQRHA